MANSALKTECKNGLISMFPGADLPPGFCLRDQMPVMLVQESGSSMLRRSIGLTFSQSQLILTFTPLGVLTRSGLSRMNKRAPAPVIAFRGRPKQDN